MLTVSQFATDVHTGKTVQVIGVQQVFGMTTYKVYEPDTGKIYNAAESTLTAESCLAQPSAAFVRFASVWCRVKNELATGTVFDVSESVIPLPHQRYALERAIATNEVRYMLADEVGLGKTIEAGLIIKELQARGLIERVLVVCPKGLMTQWEAEMLEKFGERFTIVQPEDYATLRKVAPDQNVFANLTHVISPMDAIKPLEERVGWSQEKIDQYNEDRIESVIAGAWDLIIIDEAHRVAGQTNEVARHKLGEMLSKASPHLLLLTATPHSGKTEPFLRLMRLLDEDAFPSVKAVVREQVAPYLIRTEKRDAVDNEGNSLFRKRHTHVMEIAWEPRHDLQRQLYEEVTEYVRNGYNKAMRERKNYIGFLMILFQRLVSSSTTAIIDAMEKRLNALEMQSEQLHSGNFNELVESEAEESLKDALMLLSTNIKEEIRQLRALLSLAKQAHVQGMDAKQEALIDLLDKIRRQEPDAKIILFTEFVATQEAIRQLAEYNGITTTLINGSMSLEERNASLDMFRRERQMLISTDAGGEGLNLQCSHIVINFDLPWNPMKIEQRIGRADRIGQSADVQVYNFILGDTVENRVRTVLEEKLAVILQELGIDKLQDVLDEGTADLDFTKVYISSIVQERHKGVYVDALNKDMQKQVKQYQAVQSVLHEEKTLETDAAAERQQHNFHMLLKEMLFEYETWKGHNPDWRFDLELSVSDKHIHDILSMRQIWHPSQGIQTVHFPNIRTENGVFSLWEVSLGDDDADKRIIAFFMNEQGIYRPAASKLIWEELLKPESNVEVGDTQEFTLDQFNTLTARAQEMATDAFLQMKASYEQRHEAQYQKQKRALMLRIEAAQRIGIDNIRIARINRLEAQLREATIAYERKQEICPTFTPMLAIITR
jgi:superfamily II DNA or RNA helicase